MKPALHLTATASLLAMFSLGAAALPMTVDLGFYAEGQQALGDPNKNPPVPSGPVAVESVSGIKFTGAWAYKLGMFDTADIVSDEINETNGVFSCGVLPAPGGDSACNETGYISNRGRPSTGGSKLVRTLDPTVYLGRYITSFSFDIWHNGNPATASIRFVDRSSGVAEYQNWSNISAGNKLWSTPQEQVVKLAQATSIEFDFGVSALGLDNLRITVDGPGAPPSGVPEPSSYALVGLALLAAGATRRRKA